MRFLLTLTLSLSMAAACSETQSERCRVICQRETDCTERNKPDDNIPYDLDECVAACVALERDSAGKRLVDKHDECAKSAGENCDALLECR